MADSSSLFWLVVVCVVSLPAVHCQDSYPLCFSVPPWSKIPRGDYAGNGADASTNGFHHTTAVSDCRSYCRDTVQTSHFGIRRNASPTTLYARAQCYCGEVSYQPAVSADQCSLTCEGDFPCGGIQTSGATGATSVYRVPPYPLCFDQLSWPEITSYTGPGANSGGGYAHATALTQCRDHCRDVANTVYFAIRRNHNGQPLDWVRCYCGEVTAQTQAPDSADQCPLTCEGDFPCGGNNYGPKTVYSACPVSKYGPSCDQDCLEDCRGGECYPDTGRCCPDGRYGDDCSQTCANTNCQVNPCDWQTGYCRGGCAGNVWFGLICGDRCTSANRHCTDDRCEQTQGDCINGCQSGWYGTQCDTPCPANCNNDICNRMTGHCNSAIPCPDNCDLECDSITGECLRCGVGWYGMECNQSCPDNCQDNCVRDSGVCYACRDGWYWHRCENQCPLFCTTCDFTSARCLTCNIGFYGESCDQPCPDNCKNNVCSREDGSCDEVGTQPWVYAVTAVLAVALAVALVVILVVCLKKRRNNNNETSIDQSDSRELGRIGNTSTDEVADPQPQYEVVGEKPYETLRN